MSASEKTKYYGLPLFAPDDVTSWEEFNKSMVEIDRLLYIAESAGGGGGGEIPPDLVDRVTALETEAASLAQEISNLGIVSSSHTDQINTLDAKAEELEADVSGLTSTTNELNVQVEDNTGDISVLVTKTNTLETEQSALGNDIADLQTTIANLISVTIQNNININYKSNVIIYHDNTLDVNNITDLGNWNLTESLGFTIINIGNVKFYKGGFKFRYSGSGKNLPLNISYISFNVDVVLQNKQILPITAKVIYYSYDGNYIQHQILCPALIMYVSTTQSAVSIYWEKTFSQIVSLQAVELLF